jgi:ABC-type lipoprotein export system ATPase subunit
MSITLQQLNIPYLPLSDSDIWNKHVQFEHGSHYHVKASSGTGKSTLIHCLYGIQKNYTGEIIYADKNLSKYTTDELCQWRASKISVVFQDLKLFEDATAFENIYVKRQQTNYYPTEKIEAFANKLNISHTLKRPISSLSYGERQRVAIVRALMQPFDILLLDEPFSHLDNENRLIASSLILEECKKRNASIIHTDLEDDDYFPYIQKLQL